MKLLAAVVAALVACSHSNSAAPVAHGPNIVFVLTDDLDVGVYQQMARLKPLLDDQGTAFTLHHLNISLCCPSRTAILRGQYAHNTKIFSNAPPTGGFETFYANMSENDTIAAWLQAAGYRTMLAGKYLNGYPNTAPPNYVPPGWSEWYSPVAGNPYSDYNYTMDENGTPVAYAATPADYMVDVIANKATDFIQRAANDHTAFFMYLAPFVPHAPATSAPRYANDFVGATAPRTASFDQVDVSKMPAWVQALPRLGPIQLADIDALYRKRLQSMEAVEDLVQNIVDTLTKTGELDNTYIVFTSDNGFHQGQHRLGSGKNTEFDEDLLVPLVVRGPGVAAAAHVDVPTINVDFAPTFLDLAGIAIPIGVDGRSLAPFLRGNAPASWRTAVFLEHAAEVPAALALQGRESIATTLEPDDVLFAPAPPAAAMSPPPFDGVRTARYTYVEYNTGDKALFDHQTDPAQLANIAATADPTMLASLASVVHAMHGCTGDACRAAEQVAAP
jgi:N-acetylglucosamine-6-sulfatase